MSGIKLNQLPNGIKQSLTPTLSGEVVKIDAGGLVLPNVATPVVGTDASNKDYVDNATGISTDIQVLTQVEEDALVPAEGLVWQNSDTGDTKIFKDSPVGLVKAYVTPPSNALFVRYLEDLLPYESAGDINLTGVLVVYLQGNVNLDGYRIVTASPMTIIGDSSLVSSFFKLNDPTEWLNTTGSISSIFSIGYYNRAMNGRNIISTNPFGLFSRTSTIARWGKSRINMRLWRDDSCLYGNESAELVGSLLPAASVELEKSGMVSTANVANIKINSDNSLRSFTMKSPDGQTVGESIYVATFDGLSVTNNNGATWLPVINSATLPTGLPSDVIREVFIFESTIVIGTNNGVAFMNQNDLFTQNPIWKVPSSGLLSSANVLDILSGGDTLYLCTTSNGIIVTSDMGETTTQITTSNGLPSNNVGSLAINGTNWYVATTDAGLAVSTDSGVSFTTIDSSNSVMTTDTCFGITFDDVFVYAGYDDGLLRVPLADADTPASWTNPLTGFTVVTVESFPKTGAPTQDAEVYIGTSDGTAPYAIGKSIDSGSNFTGFADMSDGLGSDFIRGLRVQRNYTAGTTIIHAATSTGFSISDDTGLNFTNYTTVDGLADDSTRRSSISFAGNLVAEGSSVSTATLDGEIDKGNTLGFPFSFNEKDNSWTFNNVMINGQDFTSVIQGTVDFDGGNPSGVNLPATQNVWTKFDDTDFFYWTQSGTNDKVAQFDAEAGAQAYTGNRNIAIEVGGTITFIRQSGGSDIHYDFCIGIDDVPQDGTGGTENSVVGLTVKNADSQLITLSSSFFNGVTKNLNIDFYFRNTSAGGGINAIQARKAVKGLR